MKSLGSCPDLIVNSQLATTFGTDVSTVKAFSLPRRGNKRVGDGAITIGGKQTLGTRSGVAIGWNLAGSGPRPRCNTLVLRAWNSRHPSHRLGHAQRPFAGQTGISHSGSQRL